MFGKGGFRLGWHVSGENLSVQDQSEVSVRLEYWLPVCVLRCTVQVCVRQHAAAPGYLFALFGG